MRIAIITHVFPPSAHPNAKRPFYYARALQNAGCEVCVFTSPFAHANETIASEPLQNVIRLPDRFSKLDVFKPYPRLYRIAYAISSGTAWPDIFASWARKTMQTLQDDKPFDRIIAFVLPPSIPVTAMQSGLSNANWIFDYQESVTPFYQQHPSRSPLKRFRRQQLARNEASALKSSGKVIFTSNTNRKAYVDNRLVEAVKTIHIPYFYQQEDFPENPAPLDQKSFRIAYFGNFDAHGHRNPKVLLKALAIFLKQHPEAIPSTKFVFYGTWRREHNLLINDFPFKQVIACHPPCPYSEYLALLQQQTALLLVVAPEHNLFMPSKVVDYFGAQRPILGFAPRDSEMWHCLESADMGEWLVAYNDADAGAAAIERLWQAHQANTLEVDTRKLQHWSSETQIPRILQAVTGEE